jgi:hypothetical protein
MVKKILSNSIATKVVAGITSVVTVGILVSSTGVYAQSLPFRVSLRNPSHKTDCDRDGYKRYNFRNDKDCRSYCENHDHSNGYGGHGKDDHDKDHGHEKDRKDRDDRNKNR